MRIEGQSAIITGAGSGMGAACARRLAAAGVKVALLDANAETVADVAREVGGMGLHCDIRDAAQTEGAIDRAFEKHGPARICINCAGVVAAERIVKRDGPASLDAFRDVIDINLIGTFNVMRLCATQMSTLEPVDEGGERGVMITTASIAAFDGQIGQAAYSASKAGIVGMTLPLARDLAKFGIRVMTIAPGLMDTPMLAGLPDKARESLAASVPFPKRFGQAEEFADLAIHIVENAMLNGGVIRLDGALRMPPS
ncbi:SDR family NAD(P)-dependent oxidoreductase [Thioalkalivibrio sp. HK1]|uniref:SDR family NAD(P)-dependent oxidoreductase n=1 Tax=Thioalkalivibrio sp. HK1 TaxID=1469245 RepID=UPI000470469E|nr:SDR family NAD(P)-dependent oxidoreductase [Thioalkalivibrio sp. HK1]